MDVIINRKNCLFYFKNYELLTFCFLKQILHMAKFYLKYIVSYLFVFLLVFSHKKYFACFSILRKCLMIIPKKMKWKTQKYFTCIFLALKQIYRPACFLKIKIFWHLILMFWNNGLIASHYLKINNKNKKETMKIRIVFFLHKNSSIQTKNSKKKGNTY